MSNPKINTAQTRGTKLLSVLAVAGALAVSGQAVAQSAAKAEDAFWYGQIQGGMLDDTNPGLRASLGGPVSLSGSQALREGRTGSLAFGRQMTYRKDNGEEVPMRLEFEAWSGRYDRESVTLGLATVKPNDRVKADVAFLNAAVRIGASDDKQAGTNSPVDQFWLKLGLGHGTVSYADASGLFNCGCLRNAKGSGLSYQLQVSYERHLNESTLVYGQLGRVWLPSAASAAVGGTQTHFDRVTPITASVGLRVLFR